MVVGKTSFEDEKLLGNYQAIIEELIRAKPSAAKGRYIRSVVVATSMGPGIKVDPSKMKDLTDEAEEVRRRVLRLADPATLLLPKDPRRRRTARGPG